MYEIPYRENFWLFQFGIDLLVTVILLEWKSWIEVTNAAAQQGFSWVSLISHVFRGSILINSRKQPPQVKFCIVSCYERRQMKLN